MKQCERVAGSGGPASRWSSTKVVEKRKEKKRIANDKGRKTEAERLRESGLPGGGQGRKDRIEKSGVYPVSAREGASPDALVHGETSWGQGERGASGYEDSGGSELIYLGKELGVNRRRHRR